MSNGFRHFYEFGEFRFDAERRVLWHGQAAVALPPKATEVLSLLLDQHGNLVERDELIQSVWQDTFVEEGNLNHAVSALRKVLGEDGIIQTVPRRGYRFTAEVKEVSNGAQQDLIIEKRTLSHTFLEEELTDYEPASAVGHFSGSRLFTFRNAIISFAILATAAVFYLNRDSLFAESKEQSATIAELSNNAGFANDGKVVADFGRKMQGAHAVAIQQDGKIVVGGWAGENIETSDAAILRLNADGTLDASFGTDGKVVTEFGKYHDSIYGLTIQPDGKIIAVGGAGIDASARNFLVVRYRSDGALDASFDSDGVVTLGVGSSGQDTAYDVVVHDGKILVAGSALNAIQADKVRVNQNDFALVQLNPDGSLDSAFGDNGKVITDFGSGGNIVYSVALQPDGRIVVGGMTAGNKNQDFGLARYESNGTLDLTFGTDGKVTTEFFGEDNLIWSISLQTDGKIVAAGYAKRMGIAEFAVTRYTPDGSLDNSFNGNGKLMINLKGGDNIRDVFVLPDGSILAGGRAGSGSSGEFGLVRIRPNGILDTAFHRTGKITIRFAGSIDAKGMVLSPDGYAISVGSVDVAQSSKFAIARTSIR